MMTTKKTKKIPYLKQGVGQKQRQKQKQKLKPSKKSLIRRMKGGQVEDTLFTNELQEIFGFYDEVSEPDIPGKVIEFKEKIEAFRISKGWRPNLMAGTLMGDGGSGVSIDTIQNLSNKYINSPDKDKAKREIKTFINNCSVCHVNTHGHNQAVYNIVPPKTIICYLTPVNYLAFHKLQKYPNDLINFMKDLNFSDMTALFLQRNNFQKGKLESFELSTADEHEDNYFKKKGIPAYQIYNCFENSVWYYPGDLYPDLKLAIAKTDFDTKNYRSTHKPIKYKMNEDITNLVLNNDNIEEYFTANPDKHLVSSMSEYIHRINNSEIYNLAKYNFRLHIVSCCRGSAYMPHKERLEVLEYELYQNTYNRLLDGNGHPDFERNCKKKIFCGDISNRRYLIQKLDDQNLALAYDASHVKFYYSGKTPSLIRINRKDKLERVDYEYIITFSIRRILLFFEKRRKKKGGDTPDGINEFEEFMLIASQNEYLKVKINKIISFLKGIDYVKLVNIINVDFVITLIQEMNNYIHQVNRIKSAKLRSYKLGLFNARKIIYDANRKIKKHSGKLDKPKNLFLTLLSSKFNHPFEYVLDFRDEDIDTYLKASKSFLHQIEKIIINYQNYLDGTKRALFGFFKSSLESKFKKLNNLNLILDTDIGGNLEIKRPVTIQKLELECQEKSLQLQSTLIKLQKLSIENCTDLNIVSGRYNLVTDFLLLNCNITNLEVRLFVGVKFLTLKAINIRNSVFMRIIDNMPDLEILHLEDLNIDSTNQPLPDNFWRRSLVNLNNLEELTLKNVTVSPQTLLLNLALPRNIKKVTMDAINFPDISPTTIQQVKDRYPAINLFIDGGDTTI